MPAGRAAGRDEPLDGHHGRMTRAVDRVLEYVARSRRGRLEQTPAARDAVAELLDEDVETRLAGGADGSVWQAYRGRSERIARLSRSEVEASRLETETVRAFGNDELGLVAVEQLSTRHRPDG